MLPTAIRRRLTLTIMCALLMTMSLLLTAPLHTAFAQTSSLALEGVFTADANGSEKTSFAPGDAIRYYAAITNSSGQPIKATLVFLSRGPRGPNPKDIFRGAYNITQPSGRVFWYDQSTIPQDAMAGEYTVTAGVKSATGGPILTKSGTFTVTSRTRSRLRWIGGTDDQHNQVLNAWVNGSRRALNASRRPADDRFITWFGAYNSNRFAYVMDNYRGVYNSMRADQYTIDFTGTGCPSGALAYTYQGARTIWLCNPYWTLPTSGMDSKIGTLLHEVTHDVAMTEDYVYGQANCKTLAANDPDKAIHNAANYKYFAMM